MRVHRCRINGQAREDRSRDSARATGTGATTGLEMGTHGVRRHDGPSPQHCPVAIVRGGHPNSTGQRWVVAEVDESAASNGVLRRAVEEARLREAPLRVLTSRQSRFTDVHDTHAVPDGNRLAKVRLDRQVAQWRKRYPDLDVETMAVHGTTLKHLTDKAGSIQLLVVGHERARGIRDLIGPPGYASLHETGCSVLICEPQNVL